MKILQLQVKTIAFFYIAMTMLYSCVTYQRVPVSLQEAEQSKKLVKLKTSTSQTYHFRQIVFEEGKFYGLKKEKGEIVKIAIHNSEANRAFLHNRSKSVWSTIAIIAVPVTIAVTIFMSDLDLGGGVNIFEE